METFESRIFILFMLLIHSFSLAINNSLYRILRFGFLFPATMEAFGHNSGSVEESLCQLEQQTRAAEDPNTIWKPLLAARLSKLCGVFALHAVSKSQQYRCLL